ncbi:endo-1,4-beta-xylanase (exopolysaccharide export) protein [Roseobacter sp. AzwK-3b]|nr:endo-1,4-beta-xylanase (exopolysaccharide export) protein [Roseobacter sp. AzwK-3b]
MSLGLQWLMTLLLAVTLLLNGAADPNTRPALAIGFALISLLALLLSVKNRASRALVRHALFWGLFLSLWSILQAVPLPLWLPVHPVWRDLSATLGTTHGYVSVNPSATWHALPSLILPFTVFATTVMLSQNEALARSFWHKLTLVGVTVVLVSVLRQVFFPDSLVFSGQALGAGQFSGVFINRNLAASAFGLAAFALLGSLAIHMAKDPWLKKKQEKGEQSNKFWMYVLLASALFLTAVCLILTRSRAGSLVSLVLLLPCLILILRHGLRERFAPWTLIRWLTSSFLLGVIALLLFLAAYGEPVLSRVEATNDTGRWCTWASTLEAIKDNPLFGTGLGTFRDIFPMYRNSGCDGSGSAWHRAHNSFLEIYLGIGLPALLFAAAVYVRVGKVLHHGLTMRRSLKGIPIAMTGAVLFVSTHSLVDFPLQIPGIALYFTALMAAGMGLCLKKQQTRRKPRRIHSMSANVRHQRSKSSG